MTDKNENGNYHDHNHDNSHETEHEKIVPEDSVKLDSFKLAESSDDDHTKIIDGEPVVKDFHLYEEKKEDHD